MARVVNVQQCGKFLTNYEAKTTHVDKLNIRTLNENLVMRPKHNADMTIGFDSYESRKVYGNNLTGLLEYISSRMETSDLKKIVNADFVMRRNFMIEIAESANVDKNRTDDNGFECLCCKFNDICFVWKLNGGKRFPAPYAKSYKVPNNIWVGVFKDQATAASSEASNSGLQSNADSIFNGDGAAGESQDGWRESSGHSETQKRMYMGKKFENYVTLEKGQIDADIQEVPSCNFDNNVVYRCQLNCSKNTPIKIYYSNEEDCVDKNGKYVELSTCNMKNWKNELRYYLRALFTNQTRLIIGKCEKNYLREVTEFNPTKSTRAIANSISCLAYLSDFLTRVKAQLNELEEGIFLRVAREPTEKEYDIEVLPDSALYNNYNRYVSEFLDLIANNNT